MIVKSLPFILNNSGEDILSRVDAQTANATTKARLTVFVTLFGDIYHILRTSGITLFVIAMAIAFIRLAMVGTTRNRDMAKDWVLRICIAAMVLGAATAIVSLLVETGREF